MCFFWPALTPLLVQLFSIFGKPILEVLAAIQSWNLIKIPNLAATLSLWSWEATSQKWSLDRVVFGGAGTENKNIFFFIENFKKYELFSVILQYAYEVPSMLLVCTNGLKSLKADDFPWCLHTLAVLILEFHSGKELELFSSLLELIVQSNQLMQSSSHDKSEKDYPGSHFC